MALADAVSSAVAAWDLDETSGTRADQVGSNDLTSSGTTGSTTGVHGNAATFVSFSNFLSSADTADLSIGDIDWMITGWFQLGRNDFDQVLIQKWDGGGGNRAISITYEVSPARLKFYVEDTGGSIGGPVTASNAGALSLDTWYLFHAWHDSVNNQLGISVHGAASSTADTLSHTTGINGSETSNFQLGGGGFEGLLDDVVILKGYILDATERDEHYNSGAGVAFADWAGGGGGLSIPIAMYHYMRTQRL